MADSVDRVQRMPFNQGKEEDGMVKYDVLIPCGLHHDSTVTIVGKPLKNFYVQLMAETSVVYMFEVVFHGDGAPFILQSQPYAFVKSVEPYTERCPAITRERFLSNGRSWPTTFGIPSFLLTSRYKCSRVHRGIA